MNQVREYDLSAANALFTNALAQRNYYAELSPYLFPLQAEHEKLPKRYVLVIDDDQTILSLMRRFLGLFGLCHRTFADPRNALLWYSKHWGSVDLVFLDMKNPFLDGEDCFAELQRINSDVNVALMSGGVDKLLIDQLLQDGALRFFAKPFDFSAAMQWAKSIAVRRHLD